MQNPRSMGIQHAVVAHFFIRWQADAGFVFVQRELAPVSKLLETGDLATLKFLWGKLAETGLTEIEVEDGERKIRVARSLAPVAATAAF